MGLAPDLLIIECAGEPWFNEINYFAFSNTYDTPSFKNSASYFSIPAGRHISLRDALQNALPITARPDTPIANSDWTASVKRRSAAADRESLTAGFAAFG